MMKRYVFFVLFCAISVVALAQKPGTNSLKLAISDLDNALVAKDTIMLRRILSESLSYGHSNGWVETKKELIADLYNGKITYKQVKTDNIEVIIEGSIASVRSVADIDAMMEGSPNLLNFKLKVLQVWMWKNEHWELFARQSVKL